MKVIDQTKNGATIHFSVEELRLIFGVLIEVRSGAYAFDDATWDDTVSLPRSLERRVIDELQPVLERANDLDDL